MWFAENRAWQVGLSTSGMVVASPRGWFGRGAGPVVVQRVNGVPAGETLPVWRPAVDALADWIRGRSGARNLRVHLASELVRWLLVPWSTQLASAQELQAYALLQLRATFGEAADGWRLGMSQPVPGEPLLVCAVEEALVQALQELEATPGVRLLQVEPYVSAALDHWRGHLGRRVAWVVVVEPEMLTLALIQHGQWRGLRQLRRNGSGPLDLAQLRPAQAQLRSVWDDDTADELPLWVIGGRDEGQARTGDGTRWLQPGGHLKGLDVQARLAWGV